MNNGKVAKGKFIKIELVEYNEDEKLVASSTDEFNMNHIELEGGRITQSVVEKFISKIDSEVKEISGKKCTIMYATLRNGFVLNEFSSSALPEDFDEEIGIEMCTKRIHDKVWYILGAILATASADLN